MPQTTKSSVLRSARTFVPTYAVRALLHTLVLMLVLSACSAGSEPALTPTGDSAEDQEAADRDAALAAQEFLDASSSSSAASFVDAVANGGDTRWVPWLIDLLRVQVSSVVDAQISETLEHITGIEATKRIPDLIAYGGWSASAALDGGAGYQEFKATLYERIDPAFGPLIRSINDPAHAAAIQWGGVPVGGIPELNNPDRVLAAEADWMVDDEVVVGVTADDASVAYPLRIIARHELVNDIVADDELAIVYCTLCRSALVFERQIDDQRLRFLTSGLLMNSNKIMLDVETNTLWQHLQGRGIGGPLTGAELAQRSVNIMRWSDWVETYPDSEVLSLPDPIFFDDPERPPISYDYTPGEAYETYYSTDEVWFPILDTPDTFKEKAEVLGIEHNGDSLAIEVAALIEGETFSIDVGGAQFQVEATGVSAEVRNEVGERVLVEQSFWFAWWANHPETRTWSG